MFKRVTIVALVVAAFVLVMAVPAMAFNGYRADYTVTSACAGCHGETPFLGAPVIVPEWAETGHGENEAYEEVKDRAVNGSVCQGCHTSNFDPAKALPTPTATTTAVAPAPAATNVAWGVDQSQVGTPQSMGEAPWSDNNIGCSSCHYGAGPVSELDGRDVNDTAHMAPYGELANADICGACHSRYSYTTSTFSVTPIPYVRLDGAGDPIPNPTPTSLIQPQMALGYPMLGSPAPSPATGWNPAAPLSDYLNIPTSGWSPTPNPAATSAGFGRLSTFWNVDGVDTLWQQVTHEGASGQYPEWANEGHADALTGLTGQAFWGFLPEDTQKECLECHSTDYRIMKEAGKNPKVADAKYGITCVGCHAPHNAGTIRGVWDKATRAQLNNDASLKGNGSNLCTECHNGEIPEGTQASPGTEIHHPMKEMMDGYGAIDVSAFPSVHKGKCIQCHMPPTYFQRGGVQRGANHTFTIIQPKDAVEASPVPVTTAVATATASPSGTVTVTTRVTWDTMPYSACSTCHNQNTNPSPKPVATVSATPSPSASPLRVNVTIDQMADGAQIYSPNTNTWSPGGDKALWLQDTIEQRQEWTKARALPPESPVDDPSTPTGTIWLELDKAAVVLGYADTAEAHEALVAKPSNTWTTAERAFLSGFTNVEFVASEGSFGLHNWDYSREIVNTAMMQAKIAATGVVVKLPWKVTLTLSKTSVKAGTSVTFSGTVKTAKGVAGVGTAEIWRRISGVGGTWKLWRSVTLNASGQYSTKTNVSTKGTSYWRTTMPADTANLVGSSTPNIKLVVK